MTVEGWLSLASGVLLLIVGTLAAVANPRDHRDDGTVLVGILVASGLMFLGATPFVNLATAVQQ